MKFKITKNYNGNIEIIYSNKFVILTDKNPSIILTEEEYETIPDYKKYLITNNFVLVDFVEEVKEIKEIKKEFKYKK